MPLNPFKQHISPSSSRASDRQNFSGLPARDRCLYLRRPSKGSRLQVWHLCGRSKTKPAPGKERECQGVPGKGGGGEWAKGTGRVKAPQLFRHQEIRGPPYRRGTGPNLRGPFPPEQGKHHNPRGNPKKKKKKKQHSI